MPTSYQKRQNLIPWGWTLRGVNTGNSSTALSAAATWVAYSFYAESAKTLNDIRVFSGTKTGTVNNGDITCSLYDSVATTTANKPNSLIETVSTNSPAWASSTWIGVTGWTATLTAGKWYWLVFKNVNGTPASNNVTISRFTDMTNVLCESSDFALTTRDASTTDSGTNWSIGTTYGGPQWIRIGFTDGTFVGFPRGAGARAGNGAGASQKVYGIIEVGGRIIPPTNARWWCSGIGMHIGKVGTPTGDLRFRLYNGNTLLGTTTALPSADFPVASSVGFIQTLHFASPIAIDDSMTLYAMAGNSAADSSSNCWSMGTVAWDTDANSAALKPNCNGFATISDNTAVSVSVDANTIVPAWLLLDTNGPEQAAATPTRVVGG